jgi:P27 family predicted phage terminase small subunit
MPNPAKPTALKKLHGNPGKRALNKNEPTAPAGAPGCPAHLKGEASKEWKRISAELEQLQLLTQCDRAALAAYCVCYADWIKAQKVIDKEGQVYESTNHNTGTTLIKIHPAVRIALDCMKLMRAYLVEFGLTPASRTRIHVDKAPTEDPMDEFLSRANQPSPN